MNRSRTDTRPWYKEPWPWVAIAIPASAVIAGFITLYLAISNPDYLVVEEDQYRQIKSELHAQGEAGSEPVSADGPDKMKPEEVKPDRLKPEHQDGAH